MALACVGRIFLLAVFISSFLLGSTELQTKNDTFIKQLLLSKQVGYSFLHEYRSILLKQDFSSLAKKDFSTCFADFEAITKDGKALMMCR